jgi:DNA-directed RNA polymerase specialized sigma subunit
MRERLKEAVRSLSEAEQLNITFYYCEGLTTEEITFLSGRIESGVHQTHASAISQLIAKLQL